MEIMEIIKEAFMFPVNNLKALAIYIVVTFVIGILTAGSLFSLIGIGNSALYGVLSAILFNTLMLSN